MGLRFTVLASGSTGNCSLVSADTGGVLIDGGLKPTDMLARFAAVALSPLQIRAMVLTHTHGDHWNDGLLGWLVERKVPLYCHPSHHHVLLRSVNFRALRVGDLVRDFHSNEEFNLPAGLRCLPVPVRHDGGATFAFRLTGPSDLFGSAFSLGYAADLGVWDEVLLNGFLHVDLLALEFNHDVTLQRQSSRPAFLIERVLGEHGHLSNDQAVDFLARLLDRQGIERLGHLVQLHLSGECNRPALARKVARNLFEQRGCSIRIHTGQQDIPLKPIEIGPLPKKRSVREPHNRLMSQPQLPGF
ncbi:MAG: MBL fold metallo-hydrolase [Planctomycetia bacterium]|nr:MBL fold metallo-hydrolase [Planctomycetia bacterium]